MFIPTHISTSDPTVTDGVNNGYRKGNYWLNSSSGDVFVCEDDSNTTAVWTQINPKTVSYVKVSLDASQVADLGTFKTLIDGAGAGTYIEVVSVGWALNHTTTLEVGSQELYIAYRSGSGYICNIANPDVESTGDKKLTLAKKANADVYENDAIVAILSAATNPISGSVTMDFYIVYKVITL